MADKATVNASPEEPWYRRVALRVSGKWVLSGVILLALGVIVGTEGSRYQHYEGRANTERDTLTAAATRSAQSGIDIELRADSGKAPQYCIVEAQPLQIPSETWRGDSIAVVFSLKPTGQCAPKNIEGFAAETDGWLTPTLTVADCTVTPQMQVLTKKTSLPPKAFVWQWSVDDCKSVGFKAVQVLLDYSGNNPAADPVAYRALKFVHVTDNFSADDAIKFASPVALVLGAITTILSLFFGKHEK